MINVMDLEFVKTKVNQPMKYILLIQNIFLKNISLFFSSSACYTVKKSTDDADNNKDAKTPKEQKKYLTTQTPLTMPGHTGYLTFATLPPIFARWNRIIRGCCVITVSEIKTEQ